MTIRTQSLLAIVPLFVLLAVLIGAVITWVQYREILWGLREEAASVAVAAARQIIPAELASLEDGPVADSLRQILEWENARRIAIADARGGLIFDSEAAAGRPSPLPALAPPSGEAGFTVGGLEGNREDGYFLRATSVVGDRADPAGVLYLELRATGVEAEFDRIVASLQVLGITCLASGLVVALLLARLLAGRIRRLNDLARHLGGPRQKFAGGEAGIQEIEDLSRTFDTMETVLEEVVARTGRAVVEAEQFRTEEDLARVLADLAMPPVELAGNGLEFAGRRADRNPAGEFFSLFASADGTVAVAGRVAGGPGIDTTRRASAAATGFREAWTYGTLPDSLIAWATDLDLVEARVVHVPGTGPAATLWTWNPGTRNFEPGRNRTDEPLILHTFDHAADQRIRAYIGAFGHLPAARLAAEIENVLDAEAAGAIVLIRPATNTRRSP